MVNIRILEYYSLCLLCVLIVHPSFPSAKFDHRWLLWSKEKHMWITMTEMIAIFEYCNENYPSVEWKWWSENDQNIYKLKFMEQLKCSIQGTMLVFFLCFCSHSYSHSRPSILSGRCYYQQVRLGHSRQQTKRKVHSHGGY